MLGNYPSFDIIAEESSTENVATRTTAWAEAICIEASYQCEDDSFYPKYAAGLRWMLGIECHEDLFRAIKLDVDENRGKPNRIPLRERACSRPHLHLIHYSDFKGTKKNAPTNMCPQNSSCGDEAMSFETDAQSCLDDCLYSAVSWGITAKYTRYTCYENVPWTSMQRKYSGTG